jgi:hypothetical protein
MAFQRAPETFVPQLPWLPVGLAYHDAVKRYQYPYSYVTYWRAAKALGQGVYTAEGRGKTAWVSRQWHEQYAINTQVEQQRRRALYEQRLREPQPIKLTGTVVPKSWFGKDIFNVHPKAVRREQRERQKRKKEMGGLSRIEKTGDGSSR